MEISAYTTAYRQYLQNRCPATHAALVERVVAVIQATHWDEPQSALDCNNVAVMALLEAESSDDLPTREMYLEMAIAVLQEGADHPLCTVHLALAQSLLGERNDASQIAFSTLLSALLPAYSDSTIPPGLVFLPTRWNNYLPADYNQLAVILDLEDGYQQSVLLATEILCQSQFVFYNASGLRFLQLATRLFPQSALLNFNLGISSIMNAQWEGLVYLHLAQQQLPNAPALMQALCLAYQNLGQLGASNFWRNQAIPLMQSHSTNWATLPLDNPFTYVTLDGSLLMAVESSFQSIVTGVLLAKGTWFEQEMDFWRESLQPGMTVIDVGANVGVYTFSAAQRVGETGRVIAIEPFSNCVQCLQETCRINDLTQVTVCRGAASDRLGSAYLSLHAASELNELVITPDATNRDVEEVPCLTLDSLLDQEQLQRVDWLKIDAEGHELQVLKGSDRLLSQFAPTILYENIAGHQGSNRPVAEYLLSKGYHLFRYQPFMKQLHPVQLDENLDGSLNIIAIPIHKT
jgi:FkbM family methyltransferase